MSMSVPEVEVDWPQVAATVEHRNGSNGHRPDAPKFSYDRGSALFTWGRVSLLFREIHPDRRTGDVQAEVVVNGVVNGAPRMIGRSRINLVSTRAKADLAKYLMAQMEAEWPALLEESCWKVIDASREGRAAVLLRDAQPPPGGRFALPPFLLARQPVMLFGNGGDWKSYLALAAGLSLHTNREIIAGLKPSAPFRVGYFDWEWDSWEHLERMRALLGPSDLPDIIYIPCASEGPLETQVDRLRAKIREHRLDYGIFDSVGLACSGAPEEAEAALGYLRALGRLEIGSLNLAHVNRGGDTQQPFGSAFWHNGVRASWYVKAVQEGETGIDVALFNRKVNSGPKVRPLGFHVEFGDRTVITRTNLGDKPELAAGLSTKERIFEAVKAGPLTYAGLATRLDIDADVIRVTARRHAGPDKTFVILTEGNQHQVALRANT